MIVIFFNKCNKEMSDRLLTGYQTQSAVLFVVFNRPDTAEKVFAEIRKVRPSRLYIAADAPREGVEDDIVLCEQTRAIVSLIDWPCDVKTRFSNKNLGCKDGVSSAVSWFFDHEEEGIILEDDCLPSLSFFKFCDAMLDKYRDDSRVRHITGCNLQQGKKWGNGTYYFSNRTHVWGWASWKRVWKEYDKYLSNYNTSDVKEKMSNIYQDPLIAECWVEVFNGLKAGKINSWAYQLDFINFFNNALTIIPNENLISNIGFDARGTHTTDQENIYANIPIVEIDEIIDPVFMIPEKQADIATLNNDFNIAVRKRKANSIKSKAKKLLNDFFKQAAVFSFLT